MLLLSFLFLGSGATPGSAQVPSWRSRDRPARLRAGHAPSPLRSPSAPCCFPEYFALSYALGGLQLVARSRCPPGSQAQAQNSLPRLENSVELSQTFLKH